MVLMVEWYRRLTTIREILGHICLKYLFLSAQGTGYGCGEEGFSAEWEGAGLAIEAK